MKNLIYAIVIALSLTACKETPQETAKDVAEARQEGAEDVREAQAERREEVAEAQQNGTPPYGTPDATGTANGVAEEVNDADYDVEVAKAKATLDTEQEKCEGLDGQARDDCKDRAKAVYDKAVADAELRRTERNAAPR